MTVEFAPTNAEAPPVEAPPAKEPALTPKPRWHDRVCACGVTFTPTGARQMFHNTTDCPAYLKHKQKMQGGGASPESTSGGVAMEVPTQRRERKRTPKRRTAAKARTNGKAAVSDEPLLARLIADCDRNLERVVEETTPLEAQAAELAERIAKLHNERDEIARIKAALKTAA